MNRDDDDDDPRHAEPKLRDLYRLARTIRSEGQTRGQVLNAILTELNRSRKRRLIVTGIEEIPRKRVRIVISTGNHYFDRVGLRLSVTPDGSLDSPPSWSADPPDVLTLVPAADGLSCDVFADIDVGAFTVTVQAPADNSSTPELESVSESFTGSYSHSKATTLAGSFLEIPKPPVP